MLRPLRPGWPLVQRRILLAAAQRGCTQEAIAAHLGVSRAKVSRWSTLTDTLRMDVEDLLGVVELAGDVAVLAALTDAVGDEPAARPAAIVAGELHEAAVDLARARRSAEADGQIDDREAAVVDAHRDRVTDLADELAGRRVQ